jgi:hypothetical protein
LAQLVLSQTQPEPVQCWPATHIAPPLHWHAPLAPQPLASVALQLLQAVPIVPH